MMSDKLKIGVLGAGHLGKVHIRCIKMLPEQYDLIGFFDPNSESAKAASSEFGLRAFDTIEKLIQECDVVDVVTPTLNHYECASSAIEAHRHVFIEKPITNTLEEAQSLMKLSAEADVKLQVGHVERFNPAFVAARDAFDDPRFIETHRLSQFNPRGTDVSVVLDLMIHDLDIVLNVVGSEVKSISASGVAVLSENPDIANARIEFENGCVANLTASRISLKQMRKSRFFQKNAYIAVDFLEKQAEIVSMKHAEGDPDPFAITVDLGEGKGHKEILFDRPEIPEDNNAIRDELSSFASAVKNNTEPVVTVTDGYKALAVAHEILEKVKAGTHVLS